MTLREQAEYAKQNTVPELTTEDLQTSLSTAATNRELGTNTNSITGKEVGSSSAPMFIFLFVVLYVVFVYKVSKKDTTLNK